MELENPEQRLAELVIAIARQEWQNEDSTTYKNRDTMPRDFRDGFVILADMGGLCVLDSRGSIRVFRHDDGREVETSDLAVRAALTELGRSHPELAKLVGAMRAT